MRKISHLTPRYIINKLIYLWYQRNNPSDPWLTQKSIRRLESLLKKDFNGLEYGAGRSTIWFSKRTNSLVSIESSEEWFEKIASELNELNISNVELIYVPDIKSNCENYVNKLSEISESSLDYVLIDGSDDRDYSIMHSISKIKIGGLLIVDNINRYMPSNSKSPGSINNKYDYFSDLWREIDKDLKTWHLIWTSDGITDTAIFTRMA